MDQNDTAVRRDRRVCLVIALLWWALSFWYERFAFEPGSAATSRFTWGCIKLLLLPTLWALLRLFFAAARDFRERGPASSTLLYALPVFLPVTAFWAVSKAWPLGPGDQFNILYAAFSYYSLGGFFFYLTVWLPMLAMNIFPHAAFAVVFKIFTISLGAGWCVYRIKRLTGSRAAWLVYFPFLVPPGLYLSYNIHRIPSYAVLYLVLSCKLLCDRLEERRLSKGVYALLCLALAALTQWRSEGVYLLVLGPIMLWFAYRPKLTKRQIALALAVFYAAELLVWFPQSREHEMSAGDRSMPLFESLITGMERKGLDREKNAAELAIVDRYIDLEALHALNEEYGDYCYVDNLILYHGMRPNPSEADKAAFREAMVRIVLRNPLVYLRNQIGCWIHISEQPYHDRKLDELANIFQRLYLPTLWLIALWVWLLVRKKWSAWFVTSAHLCHMAITTALLPAAYFKYYYSEYLYAFLTAALALALLLRRRRERNAAAVVTARSNGKEDPHADSL